MKTSRRKFVAGTVCGITGAGLAGSYSIQAATGDSPKDNAKTVFQLHPIGRVEVKDAAASLRIFEEYKDGLLGLSDWSHVLVFYWFDKNDTPEQRRILKVHPRGNNANPLTGVFACRSPFRPNLIALSLCKIKLVEGAIIHVDNIDAFDGTPILDLKPFTPQDAPPANTVRVPAWARGGR